MGTKWILYSGPLVGLFCNLLVFLDLDSAAELKLKGTPVKLQPNVVLGRAEDIGTNKVSDIIEDKHVKFDISKKSDILERDAEVDDFFDPNDSMSVRSSTDVESSHGLERSLNANTPFSKFYDAWEGFNVTNSACCGLGRYNGWIMCLSPGMACGNASNHLWWDQFHPTAAVNEILADNVWSGLHTNMCYPMNLKEMIAQRVR